MAKSLSLLTISLLMFLYGCASQRATVITGGDYDESKNQTDYFVSPYGAVSIPGKWEKRHYNNVSGQQFFTNQDSIRIAIAFSRYNNYEFNVDGSKKGFEFLEAYYDWDSKYHLETNGLHSKIIETDTTNNFIIFHFTGMARGATFDSYFLFGERNGNVSNFSVSITDKWNEDKKITFLKNLYLKE